MGQQLTLNILGLVTHPNKFSEAESGGLSIADNIIINRESIAEPRRGHKQYGDEDLVPGNNIVDRMFEYKDHLMIHYSDRLAYDSDQLGAWIEYPGSYTSPDTNFRIRSIEANRNFYFNSGTGVKKIDGVGNVPTESGAPKGLGGIGSVTGANGFMADDTAVAYRIVWGYEDANKNLILGTPSQRLVITNNAGGTRDVQLNFIIPDDVTTNWVYFLYRSNPSVNAATTPDDELQLIAEDNPTSLDITSGDITIIDSTLDELKGGALYTNQAQQTILQTNDQAPFCKDMAVYKNVAFYANTRTKHRYTFALISVGGTLGLQVGDTITINGIIYTGAALEDVASNEFFVDTSGTPSQNIDTTALSLIRVVNQSTTTNNIYMYYLSGFEDIPGKMLIEERGVGGTGFVVNSSRETCWAPKLQPSGTDQVSDNEERPNRIYYSKFQQPEAVPLLNFIDIGSADSPIRRVVSLRDSIMIFKDDGIFRLTGTIAPFNVYPFNESIRLKSNESAVVLDNRIYCMSDQGVVAVHDSGVEIVSRPIENSIIPLTSDLFPNFESATFGMGYESDRQYILYLPTTASDVTATQAYVFNTITKAWTRWDKPYTAGIVNPFDDRTYMAEPVLKQIYRERKDRTLDDYADEQYPVTVTGTGVTPNELEVYLLDTSVVEVGMSLRQGEFASRITEVIDATTITVFTDRAWVNGGATVNKPFTSKVEWLQQSAENPGIYKHWRESTFLFDNASFTSILGGFSGDIVGVRNVTLIPLESSVFSGAVWGQFDWGAVVWGGVDGSGAGATSTIRTYFPRDAQRSHWCVISLTLEEAFASFSLAGVSMEFTLTSGNQR